MINSIQPATYSPRLPTENTQDDKPFKADPRQNQDLDLSEQQEVTRLKARDTEVRAHEQAHIAAGGSAVSGRATFTYTTGPDGRRYATGGEVAVDTSKSDDPEANLQKARLIRRAALAPAQPSGTDLRIASQAALMEAEAQREIRQESEKAYQPETLKEPGQMVDTLV